MYPWYGDIEGAWSLDDFTKNFDHYLEVRSNDVTAVIVVCFQTII